MAGTPIRERIILDLLAHLQTMHEGLDYWYTPSSVLRGKGNPLTQQEHYGIRLYEGRESYGSFGISAATVPSGFTGCRLEIELIFEMLDVHPQQGATVGANILCDLQKAVLRPDETIVGGVQLHIEPTESIVDDISPDDTTVSGSLLVVLQYNVRRGDPARAT